jgi:hypothetical protein
MDLSHVILHVGLCSAIARTNAATQFGLQVRVVDIRGIVRFTRNFRLERGDDDGPKIVEFDMAPGTYRLDAAVPKYGCSASDFLTFLEGHGRVIDETLSARNSAPGPQILIDGASPQSFLYVNPTFVLLNKNTNGCNKPTVDFLPMQVSVENDQDGYYATLEADPAAGSAPGQLALRLRTSTHQYHYVRVPLPFPVPWGGFPENVHFDVTQDEIDGLATQPVNTLLCLKLWETKVYI